MLIRWTGGPGLDHHRRNGGRGICQQKLPAGLGIWIFFQMPGGLPGGGMLKAICQDLCFNRHIQFSAASPTKNTARQEMRVSEEHGQRNKNNKRLLVSHTWAEQFSKHVIWVWKNVMGGRLFKLEYAQTCRRSVYLSYNVIKRGGAFIWVRICSNNMQEGRLFEWCASQFQPRASSPSKTLANPGHLEKLVKCSALWANFVGKCPVLHSYYDGQMPGPPVHPTNIQKY